MPENYHFHNYSHSQCLSPVGTRQLASNQLKASVTYLDLRPFWDNYMNTWRRTRGAWNNNSPYLQQTARPRRKQHTFGIVVDLTGAWMASTCSRAGAFGADGTAETYFSLLSCLPQHCKAQNSLICAAVLLRNYLLSSILLLAAVSGSWCSTIERLTDPASLLHHL